MVLFGVECTHNIFELHDFLLENSDFRLLVLCCFLLLFQVSYQSLCVASEAILQFLILYFQLSVLLHDLVDAPF
jgi:hypothetical protein